MPSTPRLGKLLEASDGDAPSLVAPVTVSMGGRGDWASIGGGLVGPTWWGGEEGYSMGLQGIRMDIEVGNTE